MNEETTTIKIRVGTRRLLRKIAADTDEKLVEVVERLAIAEWQRMLAASKEGDADTTGTGSLGGGGGVK